MEDHLNIIIEQIDATDMKVPLNEFDGRVVYGQRRQNAGTGYVGHVDQLVPIVQRLAQLERNAQTGFLKRAYDAELLA